MTRLLLLFTIAMSILLLTPLQKSQPGADQQKVHDSTYQGIIGTLAEMEELQAIEALILVASPSTHPISYH